jgi:hypothetical protein
MGRAIPSSGAHQETNGDSTLERRAERSDLTDLEDRVSELEDRVEVLESSLRAEFSEAWDEYTRRENE